MAGTHPWWDQFQQPTRKYKLSPPLAPGAPFARGGGGATPSEGAPTKKKQAFEGQIFRYFVISSMKINLFGIKCNDLQYKKCSTIPPSRRNVMVSHEMEH